MTEIIPYPSPNYAERLPGSSIKYLILHYTACNLEMSLKILTDNNSSNPVSAHYVIDEAGCIYQLVDEVYQAWHAGVSFWKNREKLNTWSIGIELVNPGHGPNCSPFPSLQMESLLGLSKKITARHQIPAYHVLGHSDIAPGRKIDPGEHFDWAWLAQNGIGVYPPLKVDVEAEVPDVMTIQVLLQDIGYRIPLSGILDSYTINVIKAFQMHFMPDSVDGRLTKALGSRLNQVKQAYTL
ncbi:MAG: N-acetylmuramoyl-L-alanine amidase [Alphaproteobacteria bacterium]|nr:N-acetylmuramoyl-L-alanine amidase [Alphaproteobacteria bacterium]